MGAALAVGLASLVGGLIMQGFGLFGSSKNARKDNRIAEEQFQHSLEIEGEINEKLEIYQKRNQDIFGPGGKMEKVDAAYLENLDAINESFSKMGDKLINDFGLSMDETQRAG
jgi:hypothetical protein